MNKLKLTLPKGSLQESTSALFQRAGFQIYTGERNYNFITDDPDIEGGSFKGAGDTEVCGDGDF